MRRTYAFLQEGDQRRHHRVPSLPQRSGGRFNGDEG